MLLLHLDDDLTLGSTLLKIGQGFPGLLERESFVDHRTNTPRVEKLSDLC